MFKIGDEVLALTTDGQSVKGIVTETASSGYVVEYKTGDQFYGYTKTEFIPKEFVEMIRDNQITNENDKNQEQERSLNKKGSRYNSGKLRWRNVPMFILRPVVEVGAAAEKIEGNPTGKYETYNFLNGLSVTDCLDSLKRHLDAVDDPRQSDIDSEDGKHHLAKVAWNALVALHYINTRPDLDDRYKG